MPLVFGGIDAFIENGSGFVNDKLGGVDTLIDIEGLAGTHANDVLRGGAADQFLRGLVIAANSPLNNDNIDLVGLQQSGIEIV